MIVLKIIIKYGNNLRFQDKKQSKRKILVADEQKIKTAIWVEHWILEAYVHSSVSERKKEKEKGKVILGGVRALGASKFHFQTFRNMDRDIWFQIYEKVKQSITGR